MLPPIMWRAPGEVKTHEDRDAGPGDELVSTRAVEAPDEPRKSKK
jgi:hypothetical protein